MASTLNDALMRLTRRAENNDRDTLIKTFVDVGHLYTLLSSFDNQILYGRRGTGKTHALQFLADKREAINDVVAYVDLRNIGSSGGVYGDQTRGLAERATCLLMDAFGAIHEAIYQSSLRDGSALDLSRLSKPLDLLIDSITQVRVVGKVQSEESTNVAASSNRQVSANVSLSTKPFVQIGEKTAQSGEVAASSKIHRDGQEQHYVNFGSVSSSLRELATVLGKSRLWILLDEWSSVPGDLQPYLADMLRRSVFPISGITVKIAAIEQRSHFQLAPFAGDYVGIEVGADAAADVNLDDFMVFDNDKERASRFFADLLFRHVTTVAPEINLPSAAELRRQAFTQSRSFEEYVQACEGVPRDAINIISLAAQKALNDPISIDHIRTAAKNWYQRDKDNVVRSSPNSHELMHWVIDKVIGGRKARAFLLASNSTYPIIDGLYDARVLHIVKRGISTHDKPGVRYDAYKLDYGCYVDLMTTAKAPKGLFALDDPVDESSHIDVPPDDYRSIRRAILDVEKFQKERQNAKPVQR